MEESRPSKLCKRVYSPDPHAALRATFSQNYINILIPALMKTSTNRSDDDTKEGNNIEMEKRVKLQVDMALAASADGFTWSRALRQKLLTEITMISSQQGPCIRQPKPYTSTLLMSKHENEFPNSFPKPLTLHGTIQNSSNFELPAGGCNYNRSKPVALKTQGAGGRKGSGKKNEEKEVHSRLMTLRGIIPGGEDMGTSDLLSELESYVVCLKLQVHILRSLVDRP